MSSTAWEDNKSRSETLLYPEKNGRSANGTRLNGGPGISRNGSRDENKLHKSLEEISKDIKELEDFISVTEEILKREREYDEQLYRRERQRKAFERRMQQIRNKCSPTKMCFGRTDSSKVKSPTFKVNITQKRRIKTFSPRSYKSRLYFRNGKIGCLEAEEAVSNLKSTHELVKRIINDENNMLVKLEHQHYTMKEEDQKQQKSPQSPQVKVGSPKLVAVGTPLETLQVCVTESASSLCDEPFKGSVGNGEGGGGDMGGASDEPGDNVSNASEPTKVDDNSASNERIIEDRDAT